MSHRLYWESTHRKWKARTGNLGPRQRNQYQGKGQTSRPKAPAFLPVNRPWSPCCSFRPPALQLRRIHTQTKCLNRGKDYWASQWTDEPSSQPKACLSFSVAPALDQVPDIGTSRSIKTEPFFRWLECLSFPKSERPCHAVSSVSTGECLGSPCISNGLPRLSHPLVSSWCGQREWLFFHASFVCHLQKAVSLSMEVTETDRSKLREDRCLPLQLHPENQWPSTVERQETFLQTMGWYQKLFAELLLNLFWI